MPDLNQIIKRLYDSKSGAVDSRMIQALALVALSDQAEKYQFYPQDLIELFQSLPPEVNIDLVSQALVNCAAFAGDESRINFIINELLKEEAKLPSTFLRSDSLLSKLLSQQALRVGFDPFVQHCGQELGEIFQYIDELKQKNNGHFDIQQDDAIALGKIYAKFLDKLTSMPFPEAMKENVTRISEHFPKDSEMSNEENKIDLNRRIAGYIFLRTLPKWLDKFATAQGFKANIAENTLVINKQLQAKVNQSSKGPSATSPWQHVWEPIAKSTLQKVDFDALYKRLQTSPSNFIPEQHAIAENYFFEPYEQFVELLLDPHEQLQNMLSVSDALLQQTETLFNNVVDDPAAALKTIEQLYQSGQLNKNFLNQTNSEGKTLLYLACEHSKKDYFDNNNHHALIKRLLEVGADPDKGPKGKAALVKSCLMGDATAAKLLIGHGANLLTTYTDQNILQLFQEGQLPLITKDQLLEVATGALLHKIEQGDLFTTAKIQNQLLDNGLIVSLSDLDQFLPQRSQGSMLYRITSAAKNTTTAQLNKILQTERSNSPESYLKLFHERNQHGHTAVTHAMHRGQQQLAQQLITNYNEAHRSKSRLRTTEKLFNSSAESLSGRSKSEEIISNDEASQINRLLDYVIEKIQDRPVSFIDNFRNHKRSMSGDYTWLLDLVDYIKAEEVPVRGAVVSRPIKETLLTHLLNGLHNLHHAAENKSDFQRNVQFAMAHTLKLMENLHLAIPVSYRQFAYKDVLETETLLNFKESSKASVRLGQNLSHMFGSRNASFDNTNTTANDKPNKSETKSHSKSDNSNEPAKPLEKFWKGTVGKSMQLLHLGGSKSADNNQETPKPKTPRG